MANHPSSIRLWWLLLKLRWRLRWMYVNVWHWLAYRLPRELVYWVGIRLLIHAVSGKWSDEDASELTAWEALDRWDERNE